MTTSSSAVSNGVPDSFDTGPLSWVIGEIREALNRSKTALHEAVAQDADAQSTSLRHARSYLHQAHGALQIVDIDGIAIITETVEDLLDRVDAKQLALTADLANAIDNAYLALIEYLDELLSGMPHQPVRLFPYYRALLEARGAERIHPADLFFPNLAVRPQLPQTGPADPVQPSKYTRLRQQFEKALLPFLKSANRDAELANAAAMREIIGEIEQLQSNQQTRAFWWVMLGLAEAAAAGQIPNEIYVKQLFARINLQIRRLSQGSSSIAERLLRDALFFIARIDDPTPRARLIRAAYQLDGLVPADYQTRRYGQIDVNALAVAKERLTQAKSIWNRIAGGDASFADSFEHEMHMLADAGSKLNSPPLSKLLRELKGIARHAAHAKPGDMLGLEMATSLLFVENALNQIGRLPENFAGRADAMTARLLAVVAGDVPAQSASWLDDMSREAQQRQTMAALAGEMQSSLRQVEKMLDEFFRDPAQRSALGQLDLILHQIEGALAILDQEDAMRTIQHTREAVQRFIAAEEEGAPEQKDFQQVAQNVGALSFFIETLQLPSDSAKKRFSFDAETGTFQANLIEKPAPREIDSETPLLEVDFPTSMEPPPATPAAPELPTVEDELAFRQQESAQLAKSLTVEPDNQALQEQLKESLEQIRLDATLVDNPEANDRAQAGIAILERPDFAASSESLAEIITATIPAPAGNEALPPIVTPETDEAIDAELLDIFLSEAEEVLGAVRQTLPESRNQPYNQEHLTTLRRCFHTLKGSSRMVGLVAFGEAAWSIEQVLNLRLSESRGGDAELYALLDKATEVLGAWVQDLKQCGKSECVPGPLVNAAERVKAGGQFSYEQETSSSPDIAPEVTSPAGVFPEDACASERQPGMDPSTESVTDELQGSDVLPDAHQPDSPPDAMASDVHSVPDAGMPETRLQAVEGVVQTDDNPHPEDAVVIRILSEGAVPQPAAVYDFAQDKPAAPVVAIADVIEFPTMHAPEMKRDDNLKRIGDLEISVPLHNIYLAETDELVRVLAQDFSEWRHEPDRHVNIQAIHAAHSLAGSSATVGFKSLQEVAHALEMVLQSLGRAPVRLVEHEFDLLEQTVERMKLTLQKFALGEMPQHQSEYARLLASMREDIERRADDEAAMAIVVPDGEFAEASLEEIVVETDGDVRTGETMETRVSQGEPNAHFALTLEPASQSDAILGTEAELSPVRDMHSETLRSLETEPAIGHDVAAQLAPSGESGAVQFTEPVVLGSETDAAAEPALQFQDELDADLMPVFLEEGRDILPQMAAVLRAWQEQPSNPGAPQSMLRSLHTLKGSARMAGAMSLGQHLHDMETRVENITRLGTPSPLAIEDLLIRHDQALHMFERLQNPHAERQGDGYTAQSGQVTAEAQQGTTAEPVVLSPSVPVQGQQFAPPAIPKTGAVTLPAAPTSMVRVRADILDRLVNQAGEVSISRSRLETEVGTLKQSLSELTENVTRLRDQLREIEMQAETQIASRMGNAGDREFDPLEFDRFTRLQELTRMMAESVNDVGSVHQNLSKTLESAVNDLSMQARLTRDLQQDLMRVRMVQFASISERLFRVTRQAAKEMDKRVNLDIRGSAVEIDRGVLERMTGPFEHLLRNAIVHGIESREARRAAGKSEIGELLIEIRQEGNEVVMQFSDDGQGLNVARIREKAGRIGLLTNDTEMSDTEVVDLIFHPGFSTAEEITELAGRGIGMDVVRSEAAALGGRVSTWSEPGKGAHFTIHLPLTLAVTQVVLLYTGGKTYAVPSVLVEQVQQLKTNALASAYNDGAVVWQGQRVPIHYLSTLLGDTAASPVSQQYSPLLILKSGNERVAVHVDEVIGNREVVVKNIGPQLARMTGVAGATVLGSGDIVLILNPLPLAQRAALGSVRAPRNTASDTPAMGAVAEMAGREPAAPGSEPVQGLRTQDIVMVVDDSLTVRRVTQRLLTREGYQVVLAKDGVDALEHLQSVTPSVMLVDIEMPRMDGFDLTRNVRGDERTRHIPIIMITSRTAAKHRNYALELGVNEYLGKPYQEEQLLELIAGFINKEASAS